MEVSDPLLADIVNGLREDVCFILISIQHRQGAKSLILFPFRLIFKTKNDFFGFTEAFHRVESGILIALVARQNITFEITFLMTNFYYSAS